LKFSIISIGTEINLGLILNTNSKYIAEVLTELGLECNFMVTVRDSEPDIVNAIKICKDLSELIIVSGGLGPTDDDLTREAIAKFLNRDLIRDNSLDESSLRFLKYIKNDVITQGLLKQSSVPEGSIPIKPRVGSASGFLFQIKDDKIIFSIPGVPREMKDMFDNDVVPFIKKKFIDKKRRHPNKRKTGPGEELKILRKTILLTTDISESQIEFLLKDIKKIAIEKNVEIGITANPGLIKIILISQSKKSSECKDNLNIIENEINKQDQDQEDMMVIKETDNTPINEMLVKSLIPKITIQQTQKNWNTFVFRPNLRGVIDNNLAYYWELGDGSISQQKVVEHQYAKSGNYQVSLKITGKNDLQISSQKNINISFFNLGNKSLIVIITLLILALLIFTFSIATGKREK